MKCPKCQFENPEGLAFCGKCGASLESICPKCNFSNPPDFLYCGKCGNKLTLSETPVVKEISVDEKLATLQRYLPKDLAQKILAQRGKIEGERKQVTVMFCDIAGFTSLTEKLGSEQMYSIMDKVYEILIHQVHDYEGTVNELTGDGIMALFGAPIALEDGPQRAIRSALAIQQEINKFNNQPDRKKEISPIEMRIGINTGQVIVGTLGNDLRVEFKAVGDTVNLASRMEGLAEPGSIYVTEETYRLARDLFHFQPLGIKKVKGKEEPIPVYKVLAAQRDIYRPRVGFERQIYSEMIGRDNELNRLEFQVMKVINGQGSVVNVIGEAGIGKSRLLAELKKREVIKAVALLEGSATSMGTNLSYHPMVDALKQWAHIRADDRNAAALAKLEAAVVNLFPEEVGEVLPFIATLMGMDLWGRYAERVKGIEGEALEKLILKNMRDLLIRATERIPVVIVTEDLHWADKSSIGLMEPLFVLADRCRIVFINLFRPGYKETGDRIAVILRERLWAHYEEIILKPLDERMSGMLISNMMDIGKLHHAIIQKLIDRAGGNPFFIEEMVRSLFDEGAIVLKDGVVEITEKAEAVTIPSSITDMLMARIDRMEEKTRHLLKVASVIGRGFFYKVLSEVANEVEDIPSRLSFLADVQLLQLRERMGEVEYLFKHALAQEAAYESLLPPRRRDLHLKVAQSIEKIFKEKLHEFYGVLAYHCSRAEDQQKTEEYLIKAGEEALRSAASDEALHYYGEALQLYMKNADPADPEKVAMLEKNIGSALFNRGRYGEAVEHFDKALNYYWDELPKSGFSTALKFLRSFITFLLALYFPHFWFKKIPTEKDAEVVDLFHKKTAALVLINPKRIFIEIFFFFNTMVRFDLTKFKLGIAIFVAATSMFSFTGLSHRIGRKILDYAKPRLAPDDARQLILYDLMNTSHLFLKGQWNEIGECNEDLVNRNLKIGEMYHASQHYYWHGLVNIYKGCFDEVRTTVTKLSEMAEAYDNNVYRLLKYLLNINLLIESHQMKEASAEVHRGIELVQKNRMPISELTVQSLKASIDLLMKQMDEARKTLDQANRIRSEVRAVPMQLSFLYRGQFEYYLCRLEGSLRNGSRKEFSEYRRNAYKSGKMLLKTSKKAALYRTESYRLMGMYNWLIGARKSAFKWWQKGISEGKRLGARPQLARLYSEIGKSLIELNGKNNKLDGLTGEEYLEKAKALFREMKIDSALGQLEIKQPV